MSDPTKNPPATVSQAIDDSSGNWPAVADPSAVLHRDPINILIVDDDPKNLTVLETVLDVPGYRLVRAETADQALLALVVEEFALLILDIRMPGMTGIELAELIRSRKKTSRIPIIFLTAYYNEDEHVLEGYGTGAVDYLRKPVNPVVLRSKVAVFADLHAKNRECGMANRALLSEVTERRRAQGQLRELNETLESRVTERTQELMRASAALTQTARELSDLHRRKDEFLAMLSHELRSPLAPIFSALQLLGLQRGSESPIQQHARNVIERQLRQLRHLIDDLLEVSRFTTGRIHLRREGVMVKNIVESAIETTAPTMQQYRHKLTLSLQQEPMWLNADPSRIEQVVVNLLTNAAKYTPEGGKVSLTVQLEGDKCVLRVRDTGIGIAPELLPRIFDLFTQGERSLDRAQGGLGIGLALVQQITELHEGKVEVKSALGHGSEFIVYLPVIECSVPPPSPQPLAHAVKESRPVQRFLRVLVVDDHEDALEAFEMLLKDLEYDVRTARDGPTAVETAIDYQPDVVFLDIGLPGFDGYEVARRLRQRPEAQSTVLVALTGYGRESDRKLSRDAGFDHHLVKPVELMKLEQILATAARTAT